MSLSTILIRRCCLMRFQSLVAMRFRCLVAALVRHQKHLPEVPKSTLEGLEINPLSLQNPSRGYQNRAKITLEGYGGAQQYPRVFQERPR